MKAKVNLYVYGVFPNAEIVEVGRILSQNLDKYGQYEGFFRYSPSYLSHPLAYSIDPAHLPLNEETFAAKDGEIGMHRVFDDSLPDAWGRQILIRKGGLQKIRYAPVQLLGLLGGSGIGRFLFSEQKKKVNYQDTSIAYVNIAKAINEAGKFEDSLDTDTAELQHLLACGSSAGGARPKVLTIKDDQHWIAKFSSHKDIHPELFIALEQAGMTLAAQAGLEVPNVKRKQVNERDVLLIKRFDVTPEGGRNALVSMRTLIGVEDQYAVSYSDMATTIRLYSAKPQVDLELLFRQMILNVLLVNTDDHLQNFSMLHTANGWQLSPSYDIVPNVYQPEQILQVNGKHVDIGKNDVIGEGKRFGFSIQKSRKLLYEVVERVIAWEDIFQQSGVPEEHTGNLQSEIRRRMKRFQSH